MSPRRLPLLPVLALLLLGAAGCSRPVAVPLPDPTPTGSAGQGCAALAAALPTTLDGAGRRDTEPGPSDLVAAWGDPPIVLRCGVGRPAALTSTSEIIEIDGVRWLGEPLSAGYRFTTSDRVPFVQVTVPESYRPEVNPLVDLAPALSRTIPVVTTPPG